jgi:RHS repeat-associated protein
VFYYFSDHLKTASVITDSAGVIKAESDYYPWGGELQFVNNDSNDYKFTGKKRDLETGLDYFGARYYSNGLGRFISADWSQVTFWCSRSAFQGLRFFRCLRQRSEGDTTPIKWLTRVNVSFTNVNVLRAREMSGKNADAGVLKVYEG